MQREAVTSNLTIEAFNFFFWFSRFEFALKENGYLKSHEAGANAEPGWDEFVAKWQDQYTPSTQARLLLTNPPECQVVNARGELDWRAVGLNDCPSDLARHQAPENRPQ